MSDSKQTKQTHFGFSAVNVTDKVNKVADVFHSVASKYDVMNDLMSLGVHRLWKRIAVEFVYARQGDCILDLAGGTGDLTALMVKQVGKAGNIVVADINDSMLSIGRDRLLNAGWVKNITYVQANAEVLPFAENSFDNVTMAFGLRNVTDQAAALTSIYQTLKPGGKLVVLEFSKPQLPGLGTLYDMYSFQVLPRLGKLIANDAQSYQYLAESIRMHPDQETLQELMAQAGFAGCDYMNLSGGIVAVHRGYKY